MLGMVVAACSGETIPTTTASAPTTTTTAPVVTDPAVDGPVFDIGLTASITTANWWAALDTEATPENQAFLAATKASLFTMTRPGLVLVPALADSEEPVTSVQRGSGWVVEQSIRDDVLWSDGEPATAEDLVFYFETVREFRLGATHAAFFPPAVTEVSAVDDHTVRIVFSEQPALTVWPTGVGMAPLVPSHFWEPHVEMARSVAESTATDLTDEEVIAAIVDANIASDSGFSADDVTPLDIDGYRGEVSAEAGREALYGVESPLEPSIGSQVFEEWVAGEMAVTRSNTSYFGRGTEYTLYSDGSIRIASPSGGDVVYGGEASGSITEHYVVGPFVSRVRWHEHESEADAYEALVAGDVDYVYDLDGMTLAMYNEMAANTDLGVSVSPAEGFRYLAFNLRKPPMSDPVFRRAVATLINKEQIGSALFAGTLFPAYTVVHPGLATFYNQDVIRPGWSGDEPMSEEDRYEAAVAMLRDAGYTWDTEPEIRYDADGSFAGVTAGEGLTMPNGDRVPELTILAAPVSGDDPMRATFALWVEQWMNDLGIEAAADPTDFDSIIDAAISPVSPEASLSWDLHVLGWGPANLSLPGLTLVALFHSSNGVDVGGLNATGYENPEFDAAADAFLAARTLDEAIAHTLEMERIVSADLPYVTLYRAPVIEAFGRNVVFPLSVFMGGHAIIPNAWPESVRLVD